jgi:hypothetical protein
MAMCKASDPLVVDFDGGNVTANDKKTQYNNVRFVRAGQ